MLDVGETCFNERYGIRLDVLSVRVTSAVLSTDEAKFVVVDIGNIFKYKYIFVLNK